MRFEHCVAVVTGAGRGIGRATALGLADEGSSVLLSDIDDIAVREVQAEIASRGAKAAVVVGNVAEREVATHLVDTAERELGRVNILVNNAGITAPALALKMTQLEWRQVIDVNLTGAFNCIQAVGASFVRTFEEHPEARCTGRIVNVSSVAGLRGTVGQVNYGAAKAGVIGLTMSIAKEWARYRVVSNAVAFGTVETRMTEVIRNDDRFRERYLQEILLRRYATSDEAARTIMFLASSDADYITGHTLNVSGGMHVGF